MRRCICVLLGSMLAALLMTQPVHAMATSASYTDDQGDLARFPTYDEGWIHEQTVLGQALACVDILGSSLTLEDYDTSDLEDDDYVFGMTLAGDLPTKRDCQDFDISSVVCLFWFWTLEFSDEGDFDFWNSYDVMLMWDCTSHHYSATVWNYLPCMEDEYQPSRVLVGIPEFIVVGPTLEMTLPARWLPEDNQYDFYWVFVTAVRFGGHAPEDVNNLGYFTGGTDFWVDLPDPDVAVVDPYPTTSIPFLPWPPQ
jgi:hypothetical protein